MMKNISRSRYVGFQLAVAAAMLAMAHTSAVAANGCVKGTVEFIRTHDSVYYANTNNWAPPVSWFTLTGVTQAATCPLWNGRVLFVAHDQQELALVLSALMGGNTLAVYYDDSLLTNTFCAPTHITIRSANAPDVN